MRLNGIIKNTKTIVGSSEHSNWEKPILKTVKKLTYLKQNILNIVQDCKEFTAKPSANKVCYNKISI